ncbi:hypothetical protein BJ508DRAFT_166316 [Ascobolus immersus RN42]|uniref:Uncharacterized protein n=1 Tax=Ascobolus immersus RN42 TaxID=1160509 RepID=A0A3N4IJR6_ASCIM|nr:hypothetical protein BJ508DRAFT_166316 [Ascobolus immersus RN42]
MEPLAGLQSSHAYVEAVLKYFSRLHQPDCTVWEALEMIDYFLSPAPNLAELSIAIHPMNASPDTLQRLPRRFIESVNSFYDNHYIGSYVYASPCPPKLTAILDQIDVLVGVLRFITSKSDYPDYPRDERTASFVRLWISVGEFFCVSMVARIQQFVGILVDERLYQRVGRGLASETQLVLIELTVAKIFLPSLRKRVRVMAEELINVGGKEYREHCFWGCTAVAPADRVHACSWYGYNLLKFFVELRAESVETRIWKYAQENTVAEGATSE